MRKTNLGLLMALCLGHSGLALAASDAVTHLAGKLGVSPEALTVEHEVSVRLDTGLLQRAKVRDLVTDRLHYVDYDAQGLVSDGDRRVREMLRIHLGIEGRLSAEVAARIRTAKETEAIQIALWLEGEPEMLEIDSATLESQSPETIHYDHQFLLSDLRDFARESQARVLPRIAALGGQVVYASPLAPLLYVDLPAGAVHTLADDPTVDHIYSAWGESQDLLNVQTCTVGVKPKVWDAGFTGSGVTVAHCEDSRADRNNTCLACDAGSNKPSSSNIDQHSTACTGMMVSDDAAYRGVAPGACFYSANGGSYSDSDMSSAIDSGAQNADLTSGSWGGYNGGLLEVHDRHTDYVVRNARHFVDDAAGNSGNGAYTSSPGSAYNSVTVACSDDNGTCDLGDDQISSFSSGKNPISAHSDRELPEIAAPGADITSLIPTASPGCATNSVGSGTSYAAPIIGGIAALAMEASPALMVWPEATKALFLASGLTNLEGNARLSDLDGAGQVDAVALVTSAATHRWAGGQLTPGRFSDGLMEVSIGSAQVGQRVKAAVCWDANPNASYATDPLEADIDLEILDPTGTVIATSASFDNSYEVVDFTAAIGGKYRARLSYRAWTGEAEYVGGAWTITTP